jgi:hypothetical protein
VNCNASGHLATLIVITVNYLTAVSISGCIGLMLNGRISNESERSSRKRQSLI